MPEGTVLRLPTGQLRVSRIVYFTDLIHSDSRELPVGVVAEVSLPSLRGISTALRPMFAKVDLEAMGPTARSILENPVEGLWPSMKQTFETSKPGAALARLTESYSSSISILAPFTLEVPRQWLLKRNPVELKALVRDRLKVVVTDEYFKFLFPPRENELTDPTVEQEMRAAA